MLNFTTNMKFVAVAAGLSVAALAAPAAAAELRAWNIHVEDYPNSIALESFAAEVADKTGGEITVKLFHNGVLGSQPDAIEQVRLGSARFTSRSKPVLWTARKTTRHPTNLSATTRLRSTTP